MRRTDDKRAATLLKMAVAIGICLIVAMRFDVSPARAEGAESKLWTRDLVISGNQVYAYTRIVLADVNNDGNDETIASVNGRKLACISSTGVMMWSSTLASDTGMALACDVDNNGAMDIVVTSTSSTMKCFYGNNGTLRWSKTAIRFGTAAAGDVDGDGWPEVVATNTTGAILCFSARNGSVEWNTRSGHSMFTPVITSLGPGNNVVLAGYPNGSVVCRYGVNGSRAWISPVASTTITPLAALDLDGDARVDIIANSSTTLYSLNGSSGSAMQSYPLYNANLRSFVIADLDHDQHLDMVARYYINSTNYSIQRVDLTTGKVAWTKFYWALSMQLADINNDGSVEICLGMNEKLSPWLCAGGIVALSPEGNIVWTFANAYFMSDFGDYVGDIAINDIDSDGHLEFVYFYSYYHNKNGYYNEIECYRVNGASWRQPGPYSCYLGSVWRTNCFIDTDGDTLVDDFERSIGLNHSSIDTDGDGLRDDREIDAGTNPLNANDPGMTPPVLSNATVMPGTGNPITGFRFNVTYSDEDNDDPAYVRVLINGTARLMAKQSPADMNYTDGCVYTASIVLDAGTYSWHVEASDGRYVVTTSPASLIVTNLPPIANFSAVMTTLPANVPFQFNDMSIDQDGLIVAWQWSFGDGSANATVKNPTHSYAAPGDYTVNLTVLDDDGASAVAGKVNYIHVTSPLAPTANFTATPTTVTEGNPAQFTDLSSDPDGSIIAWDWNFGDGTGNSTQEDPSHVYDTQGNYTVTLTVTDNGGEKSTCQKVDYITVIQNQAPVANFTADQVVVVEGFQVSFTDLSTDDGSVVAWEWDFGDGFGIATVPNPAYAYNDSGSYTITLAVTDNLGAKTYEVKVDYITVFDDVPLPDFNSSTNVTNEGESVWFFYQGTGSTPFEYLWNFGDGTANVTDNQSPEHIYYIVGTFTVTLTVVDDDGSTATCQKVDYITVIGVDPVPDFNSTATTVNVDETVQFFYQGTGSWPETYEWNFGDGTANATDLDSPEHVYTIAGTYTVTLTVVDGSGSTATCQKVAYMTVLLVGIVPNFIANVTTIVEWEFVQFLYTGSGSAPASYQWNFGDGTGNATLQDPVHQFTRNGTYSITLTVVDGGGHTSTCRKSDYIQVFNNPPGVTITVNATSVKVGQSVLFNCTWTGGDGPFNVSWPESSTSHTFIISIKFMVPGNYTIRCILIDADGDVASAEVTIVVTSTRPQQPGRTWTIEITITITIMLGGGMAVAASAVVTKQVKARKKTRNPEFL